MRAVAVRQFRVAPELMDVPDVTPGPDELLVQVEFAGMNPLDAKIADGLWEGRRPHRFPLILGVDASGTVESIGPRVERFHPGDRVVGQFVHDPVGGGTYVERTTVPEGIGIVRVPGSLPSEEAAALPTSGMTALVAVDALALAPGSTVLIAGASGGIGSFATQMAVARGIRVVALARRASAGRLRALGAEEVVDLSDLDITSEPLPNAPRNWDGLLDTMNDRADFARLAGRVRPGGVAVSTRYAAEPTSLEVSNVRGVNIDLHPTAVLMDRLVHEVVEGRVKVPIERSIALSEAPDALAELKAGRGRGKTVVDPRQ